jgi:hypothetical protein
VRLSRPGVSLSSPCSFSRGGEVCETISCPLDKHPRKLAKWKTGSFADKNKMNSDYIKCSRTFTIVRKSSLVCIPIMYL